MLHQDSAGGASPLPGIPINHFHYLRRGGGWLDRARQGLYQPRNHPWCWVILLGGYLLQVMDRPNHLVQLAD